MKIRICLAMAATTFLFSSIAEAKDEGFYVGASIGLASTQLQISDPDLDDLDFDESDFAYKLYGGYQFSPLFAVEGGYRDMGSPSSGAVGVDLAGFDVFGVVGMPLGPVRIFAKAGGIYWDSDVRIRNEGRIEHDGFDLGLGAGLEIEIGSLAVRGEVEYFDVLDDALMFSVGTTITF